MSGKKSKADVLKDVARIGSDLDTGWRLVQNFLFGHGADGDANPSKVGMQANKSGRGPIDETNYLEALSLAEVKLLKELNNLDRTAVNEMAYKVTHIIASYPVPKQIDIIVYLGLGERSVTSKKFSGKYDKKGNKIFDETTTVQNERGVNILMSWMQKTPAEIRSIIDSTVSGDDHIKYRLSQIEDQAKKYVDKMEAKHGELPERPSLEELREKNGTGPFSSLWKTVKRREK